MHKFKIESMNCMSCVHQADVKSKTLTVDSKLPVDTLKKLIEDEVIL